LLFQDNCSIIPPARNYENRAWGAARLQVNELEEKFPEVRL
jgi:hypothetical protein